MLTQDLLRELFDYNPETGEFTRRQRVGGNKKEVSHRGYKSVRVAGKTHDVHRLIWLWVYGELPKGKVIDHINGDKQDNRLCNLRLADKSKNAANCKLPSNNSSGYKGVYFNKRKGRFFAFIQANKKRHFLGSFNTPEEAARAYDEEAIKRFGQFAKTNAVLGLL